MWQARFGHVRDDDGETALEERGAKGGGGGGGEGTKARVNKTQWRIQTQEQQHAQQTNGTAMRDPRNTCTENTWSQTKESKMIIYPPYSDSGSGINA